VVTRSEGGGAERLSALLRLAFEHPGFGSQRVWPAMMPSVTTPTSACSN